MTRTGEIEGCALTGVGGSRLGTVEHVLFHPGEPRAVALQVRPNPVLYVVAKPVTFVPFADVAVSGGTVSLGESKKLPSRKRTEESIGHDMDVTVIWTRMPVKDRDGHAIGAVADVELDQSGAVTAMTVSTGVVGDVAHGRLDVPGQVVTGFDGTGVRVSVPLSELEVSGGLAKAAAAGVAAVGERADTVAKATGAAVVDASYITGRAIRAATTSKPAKRARKALGGLAEAFRQGMREDDETKR